MTISVLPETSAEILTLNVGSAEIGTAHEPGATRCPSVKEAPDGNPRKLTKLLIGNASGGPMPIASEVSDAGLATILGATAMRG